MNPILQFKNVYVYYDDIPAVKNVSLEVREHEIIGFIGPSGCGKSTLLKSINRLIDLIPNGKVEGSIYWKDKNIYDTDVDVYDLRRHIGMVFQQPNPFPKSIYDNVAYGPRLLNIKDKQSLDEIVEESLKKAALWDEVKDMLHKNGMDLSGGQQQRLCIARALAVKPEIILMDEPTSALDPISTMKMEDLVMELKKDYTIVIVTHNMQQALRISDDTAFFLHGELVEFNRTKELFLNPKNKKTEDYISGRFG